MLQTPIQNRAGSESELFVNAFNKDLTNMARHHANMRSSNNESLSIDKDFDDDDECNVMNKEDLDEGKNRDIVTARATPIKSNALAKKNLTTARKMSQ